MVGYNEYSDTIVSEQKKIENFREFLSNEENWV